MKQADAAAHLVLGSADSPASLLFCAALYRSFFTAYRECFLVVTANETDVFGSFLPAFAGTLQAFPNLRFDTHLAGLNLPANREDRIRFRTELKDHRMIPRSLIGAEETRKLWRIALFGSQPTRKVRENLLSTDDPDKILEYLPHRDAQVEGILRAAKKAVDGRFDCHLSRRAEKATRGAVKGADMLPIIRELVSLKGNGTHVMVESGRRALS